MDKSRSHRLTGYPPRYVTQLLTTFTLCIDTSWISSTSAAAKATTHTMYQACARTAGDDEFLLVRFQVVCLLTGLIAVMLVRRQKAAAASLFDQRRLNLQKNRSEHNIPPANATSTSNNSGAVEMSSNVATSIRNEETKALISSSSDNDGLDVV
jgi:hypothetical protein